MVMPYTFASQSGNLAHSFSLGVPVVAAGLEGLKAELEASGAGIVVPPEDDGELKRGIVSIMQDNELRKLYSERALRYVREHISWSITAQKHVRLYGKLLSARGAPPAGLREEALLGLDNPSRGEVHR
jgi:glycosyltransferase involved in cell wall biosynthesis